MLNGLPMGGFGHFPRLSGPGARSPAETKKAGPDLALDLMEDAPYGRSAIGAEGLS